jgi:hypothetical protein
MSYYEEFSNDNVWHQRLLRRLGRAAQRLKVKHFVLLTLVGVALIATHLLYAAWRGELPTVIEVPELQNSTAMTPDEIVALANETVEQAGELYGALPEHIDAYSWFLNRSDDTVDPVVLNERVTYRNASGLVLVSSTIDDSQYVCQNVTIDEVLPASEKGHLELARLYGLTSAFLRNNRNVLNGTKKHCACGAQFGILKNHLAIYQDASEPHHSHEHDGEEAMHVDDNTLHLFNMYDTTEVEYDQMNALGLRDANQGLIAVKENQNERYNDGRGEFTVLRRSHIKLTAVDSMWHRDVIRFSGPLGICVQRCLDLMRGIDVRERARMQWAAARVEFNAEYFQKSSERPPEYGGGPVVRAKPRVNDEL